MLAAGCEFRYHRAWGEAVPPCQPRTGPTAASFALPGSKVVPTNSSTWDYSHLNTPLRARYTPCPCKSRGSPKLPPCPHWHCGSPEMLELNPSLEAPRLCQHRALRAGLISTGREAHQHCYLLLWWPCAVVPPLALALNTALRLVAALTVPHYIPAPQSDPKLLIYKTAPCATSAAEGAKEGGSIFPRRTLFCIQSYAINFPVHRLSLPLWTSTLGNCQEEQETACCWMPYRLENLSVFSSPFVTILWQKWVWGSCEGLLRRDTASVNYLTWTLQPFLVFATGEKSSFRGGEGEWSN